MTDLWLGTFSGIDLFVVVHPELVECSGVVVEVTMWHQFKVDQ